MNHAGTWRRGTSRIISAADYKRVARRRLPRMVFDFLEGAALDELTATRNSGDLRDVRFRQRTFSPGSTLDTSVSMLGADCHIPFFVAPMGLLSVLHPDADPGVARAAYEAGAIFIHSAWSGAPLDEVVTAAPGRVWSQVYFWRNRAYTERHIEVARSLGVDTLVLPGDCIMNDKRERDLRHGLDDLPPKLTLRDAASCAAHPRWVSNVLLRRPITYANYLQDGKALRMKQMKHWMTQNDDVSVSWSDVAKVREAWNGRLVIKGIMCGDDARIALEHGADAIYVSNHGGRQFDRQPSTLAALDDVVATVDGRCEVYVDGAVTRGADALAYLSAGATAAGIGRSIAYSLAAGGQDAVASLLNILTSEFTQAMGFCGVTSAREVGGQVRSDQRDYAKAWS